MDLFAYAQINDLQDLAKANNIEVPRLRGYRLMKCEEPIDIQEAIKESDIEISVAKNILEAIWDVNKGWRECSWKTDCYKEYYLNWHRDENGIKRYDSIRWDRIHGKHRKLLKFEIKKRKKAAIKQWSIFNKYAGCSDVLYIHSRIGGNNWTYYDGPELEKQSWFLEKVDDYWDQTYCDIYAKITNPMEVNNESTN